MLGGEGFEFQAVERGLATALFAVAELVGLARRFLMDRFSICLGWLVRGVRFQWLAALVSMFTTELIVSELVTNAVRCGDAAIELRLIRDSTLNCEVSDDSGTAPHLRRARVFGEGGRGLLFVAQVSERWQPPDAHRQDHLGGTALPDETTPRP